MRNPENNRKRYQEFARKHHGELPPEMIGERVTRATKKDPGAPDATHKGVLARIRERITGRGEEAKDEKK